MITHRVAQAVVLMDRGLLRKINPVTWLCSVASCSLRDCLNESSRESHTTAAMPLHLSASSMIHNRSFEFWRVIKIILSGRMPKRVNAGGNIFCFGAIQTAIPLFCISGVRMPDTNPVDAENDSSFAQMNSCTAPRGNCFEWKAPLNGSKNS